jgi:uncharacterized protein (TIGR02599 family)
VLVYQEHPPSTRRGGFTLIELLVATTIVMMLLVGILSALGQFSSVWQRMSDKVDAFQNARLAFELLSANLSRATLNTYVDYDNPQNPTRYQRTSELALLSAPAGAGGIPGTEGTGQAVFFQLPSGYTSQQSKFGKLKALLNTCGYFVEFGKNSSIPNHVSSAANPSRFRLMQLLVPAEENTIYEPYAYSTDWVTQLPTTGAAPVADNVIALVIRAQDPGKSPADLSNNYHYDTRLNAGNSPQPATAHQLPPTLALTMIVLDERSAKRLENGTAVPAAITTALQGKFATQDEDQFQSDLQAVETALTQAGLTYRVFSSSISLKESKWSQ